MADAQITNYASLSDAATDYLEQSGNTVFTDQMDRFIGLAEANFNRLILSRRAETNTTLTTDSSGIVALPSDFLAFRSANVAQSYLTPLTTIPQGAIAVNFPVNSGGDPYALSVINGSIYINPPAIRDVTFDYYAKFIGLSDSNATNWLITNHPDYYLNGVLVQGCEFLQDWENMAVYEARKNKIEGEILSLYGMEQYFNAGMTLSGVTP